MGFSSAGGYVPPGGAFASEREGEQPRKRSTSSMEMTVQQCLERNVDVIDDYMGKLCDDDQIKYQFSYGIEYIGRNDSFALVVVAARELLRMKQCESQCNQCRMTHLGIQMMKLLKKSRRRLLLCWCGTRLGTLPFAVTLLAHGECYNDIPLWKLETKKSPSDALKNGWL
jgi:hypothetical protein